ncbi:MAG: energy transducer TonB [Bacteroidota bacterium]
MPVIFIVTGIVFFGCSATNESTYGSNARYFRGIDSLFVSAYSNYELGKYDAALKQFNLLAAVDSLYIHYEGYAFRAQCLLNLGYGGVGLSSLDTAIVFASRRRISNIIDSSVIKADLIQYKTEFPNLPQYLQRSGGFLPYDSLPRPIEYLNARYPEAALKNHLSGFVIIEFRLNAQGNVTAMQINESSDKIFNESVLAAADKWRFTPLIKKGRKTPSKLMIPFRFRVK